jgi:hypothetical protein
VPSLRSRIVPTGRMHRLARMVGRRNTLKRPVDRLEGAILIALVAMFGVAVAVGAILGTRTYATQRAASSGLRPVTAVLLQPGPPDGSLPRLGQARASWPAPGGERSGVLTTATVPGIVGAAAGTRMPVWLTSAGQPAAPPPGQAVMIIYALVTSGAVAAIAVVALLIAYAVARHALDRRRLAAWELAWDWTGPSWTARR